MAVASIVLGVAAMVVSHGAHDRVETGDPASLGPPPSTAPGSNGSTPGTGPTLTGMPFDQLPARGIDRVQPDGTRSTLADGAQAVGHWAGALPAPDGRWVLGQWSGECEVPTAYVVPADGGDPQPLMVDVDGVVPETFGLGWAPDGRAVVWALAGSCGTGVDDPGVYLVDPDTRQASLIVDVRARDGMDAVAAGVWTREAGDPQPLS